MTKQEAIQNLRTLLIYLFDDSATIRRIVHDVGLDSARINLAGSVENSWQAVLLEADKSGKMAQLVRVASNEYPARAEMLDERLRAYRAAVSESGDTESSPQSASSHSRNPETEAQIRTWQYPAGDGVASVAISGDGNTIIAGTLGKTVLGLNQWGEQQWLRTVGNQAWRAAISRNGQIVVVGTGSSRPWDMQGRGLYCFAGDGTLLWQADLRASVWGLALSDDGGTIAVGTSAKQLLLYDNQGNRLWQQNVPGLGWYAWVWCTALSADGLVVAAGAADKRVRLLDRGGRALAEHRTRGDVFTVSLSADGTDLVAGDNEQHIYWLEDGDHLLWEEKLDDKIWAVVLTANGDSVLVGAGEKETHLRLYDRTGQLLWRRYVGASVTRLGMSTQSQHIVAGMRDGGVHILDRDGHVLHQAQAHKVTRDVAISGRGEAVVAG